MKKLTYLLFISLVFFTACKKEIKTDAQLISDRLQEVIKNETVVRVIPTTDYIPGGGTITYQAGYGKSYQFNPPFITIESTSYNLGSLKNYYISYIDNEKTLFLVF
jgi:hypothetical protein